MVRPRGHIFSLKVFCQISGNNIQDVSSQLATKKFIVITLFVLFSLIFIGGIFTVTNNITAGT